MNFALTSGYLEAEFSFHETNHIWNKFPEDGRHLADFRREGYFKTGKAFHKKGTENKVLPSLH